MNRKGYTLLGWVVWQLASRIFFGKKTHDKRAKLAAAAVVLAVLGGGVVAARASSSSSDDE
jgi:uncharacterized membrane protein